MKIGIVGIGIVGGAVKYGFEKLGHEVFIHDIKQGTTISNVLNTEICFICVPTPAKENGECDTTIPEKTISDLMNLNYSGIIVIKSTVSPGTTKRFQKQFNNNKICFVPEFLRERCAITDFTENHDVCIIGTDDEICYLKIKEAHGKYPQKFVWLNPLEAELCKYFNNNYNATLITFANSFYEVCKSLGANYTNIKNAIVNRNHITDIYLDCNDNCRGFGGVCLPKDLKAIDYVCSQNKLEVNFFKNILEENKKYKLTVFERMRKE